jgi:hypothetical protein
MSVNWTELDFGTTILLNTSVVPTTPPSTNQPLPQSTLIKIRTSTTCPFTTNQKYHIESCTVMEVEMVKYLA